MTVQLVNFNGNKKALAQQLAADPAVVMFYDPSIVNERWFNGSEIKPGEHLYVVMDHPRRSRFAVVERSANGSFTVA